MNGALVVDLLTRAHRLGFEFRYLHGIEPSVKVTGHHRDDLEPELTRIINELVTYRPGVLEVLGRRCTVRTCTNTHWIREYGTDLAWCRGHAGARGLQLLREEHPELLTTEETSDAAA